MRIAWHSWEPGMFGVDKTSAGGAPWITDIFLQWLLCGHEVQWLTADTSKPCVIPSVKLSPSLDKVDVVVMPWRWAMPERPERQAAYEWQNSMIAEAIRKKIPVIIHDEDHKMTPEQITELRGHGVTLTAPELFPRKSFRTLMFPNPFKMTDPKRQRTPFLSLTSLIYIGNNYERYEQAKHFIPGFAKERVTEIYGNWMEKGPGREDPKKVAKDFPNVIFKGRLGQKGVIEKLKEADFTIQLAKQSYCETGFITLRWAEAAAAATPAFIPYDFHLSPKHHDFLGPMIVKDHKDMLYVDSQYTAKEWTMAAIEQQKFVNDVMKLQPWLDIISDI